MAFYDDMVNDGVHTRILQRLGNDLLPLNLVSTKDLIRYPVAFMYVLDEKGCLTVKSRVPLPNTPSLN